MPPNPYTTAATDWIRTRQTGLIAQRSWNQTPDVFESAERSRLNLAAGLGDHAHEPGVGAAIGSYFEHLDRAIENLGSLRELAQKR